MPSSIDLFGCSEFRATSPSFWQWFVNQDAVADSDDFEKLVLGCELIAAIDDAELLAA